MKGFLNKGVPQRIEDYADFIGISSSSQLGVLELKN